jgi:hypothetical protein
MSVTFEHAFTGKATGFVQERLLRLSAVVALADYARRRTDGRAYRRRWLFHL